MSEPSLLSLRAEVERRAEQLAVTGDDDGPEAFELAHLWAQLEAALAMEDWAVGRGPLEQGLAGAYLSWVDNGTVGSRDQVLDLSCRLAEQASAPGGDRGLEEEHESIRREVGRFADERVSPLAEHIHLDHALLPEELLSALAELGAFGVSIPETYGGCFIDQRMMIVLTEELSRGSLGAGGSVVTRPEICAKALLKGGTESQKSRWLPQIASGETMVAVAVTEPDAGSDVASLAMKADRVDGGYRLYGEKTWVTFGGRAELLVLLARTGRAEDKHRGLTLFLVDKPASRDRQFHFERGGGVMSGRAIPTVGYRGMHSFAVSFDGWFVPEAQRIGEDGRGFGLCMEGFSGGRLQTAARALGVMEAALRHTVVQVTQRLVFGRPLLEQPLAAARLVEMAARVQASRQLAYRVGDRIDAGDPAGAVLAAVVKLLACSDAEWVTRQAMQLHGGLGYAEECAVSRLWLDARVLSIFEGAEEVLALKVITRSLLQRREVCA